MKTNFFDYLKQGKSNNYLLAEYDKFKAGEVAKILTKKFKTKIFAKELECFASEWHHAGAFKSYTGKLTGRKIRFFTQEQIECITFEEIVKNRTQEQILLEKGKGYVKGWYVRFDRVKVNHYGKLGYKPFLALYEGPKSWTPSTFNELSDEQFADAKNYEGKQLKPYCNYYHELA